MATEFTVISGKGDEQRQYRMATDEERMGHFKNVVASVCRDAQCTWQEIWKEMQGSVVDGYMILPEAEKGFKPKCGWPELLEKIWLLNHYLDYLQRFSRAD